MCHPISILKTQNRRCIESPDTIKFNISHPGVSSLSDNERMVYKQPWGVKIGGKSVQNRGQSVILSGENHCLPYTITGGDIFFLFIARLRSEAGHCYVVFPRVNKSFYVQVQAKN